VLETGILCNAGRLKSTVTLGRRAMPNANSTCRKRANNGHNPTLIVKRVVVERNGKPVYDEQFHAGVNVIRGENSSGKSTVLNFIPSYLRSPPKLKPA
jgi:ABC-type molybdenum transport system ATPase subunit/photorepair protein PhrA